MLYIIFDGSSDSLFPTMIALFLYGVFLYLVATPQQPTPTVAYIPIYAYIIQHINTVSLYNHSYRIPYNVEVVFIYEMHK